MNSDNSFANDIPIVKYPLLHNSLGIKFVLRKMISWQTNREKFKGYWFSVGLNDGDVADLSLSTL